MTEFVPTAKGTNIRNPSTALLTIDSEDRVSPLITNPFDFQIQRNTNILSGFFTRLAVTEVVMNYCNYNVYSGSSIISFDISGHSGTVDINLEYGNYTAYQVLQTIVGELNDLSGTTGAEFSILTKKTATDDGLTSSELSKIGFSAGIEWALSCFVAGTLTPLYFEVVDGDLLQDKLKIYNLDGTTILGYMPDLRRTRYLDIVSTQITYCQDIKDSSTSSNVRDSLCRFYLANEVTQYDEGGLILYPGYLLVQIYRQFTFPKQIKWDNIQPIGNLTFQIYGSDGQLLSSDSLTNNWQMSLLVSEV